MNVFEQYGGYIAPPPPPPLPEPEFDPFERYGGRLASYNIPKVIEFHEKFQELFRPHRYKILRGGRGSMKSWAVARALLVLGLQKKLRILCCREFQTNIEDSVYQLLSDQIDVMGLAPWYRKSKNQLTATNGTTFRFLGLGDMGTSGNRTKIKSFEGVDIVWVEEAESIPEMTWQKLIPTIRKAGSEIWIVFNPDLETDSTYKRFVLKPPPGAITIEMNWRENLWFSDEMRMEKDHLYAVDPEAAAHVWDGELRTHANATVLKDKYIVHTFEPPTEVTERNKMKWYHGVDWGFSQDPTVIVRMWITEEMELTPDGRNVKVEHLWIYQDEWKIGCELDHTPELFDRMETARRWQIKADSSRPESISYVKRQGFNISAAEKWSGSVEDGIAHLRAFKWIHIHADKAKHTAQEARLYKFKEDKQTGAILTEPIDAHNHCIDAIRYGLDGLIQRRGVHNIWAKLGGAQ